MLIHPHQKLLHQSEGNFNVYLHAKNQLYLRLFKIIANLFWVILGNLGMLDHTLIKL